MATSGLERRGRKIVWPREMVTPMGFKNKIQCQAERLEPMSDVFGGVGENWTKCHGKCSADDAVCSIHRRMVNAAAATGGVRTGGVAIVKVPWQAFNNPGCKFPPPLARTIAVTNPLNVTDITDADIDKQKYEIWNQTQLIQAARIAFKKAYA